MALSFTNQIAVKQKENGEKEESHRITKKEQPLRNRQKMRERRKNTELQKG